MTEADRERYSRQLRFREIGEEGQDLICAARVAVVGWAPQRPPPPGRARPGGEDRPRGGDGVADRSGRDAARALPPRGGDEPGGAGAGGPIEPLWRPPASLRGRRRVRAGGAGT